MASTEKKRLSLPFGAVPNKPFEGILMTSFALPERPRSKRARYPKVRTGCISCKKRHVKCDEAKPSCNRCLKWSGACGGYEPSRSNSCPPKSTVAGRRGSKSPKSRLVKMFEPTSPVPTTSDESVVTPSVTTSEPATPPAWFPPYQSLDDFTEDYNNCYTFGSLGTVELSGMSTPSNSGTSSGSSGSSGGGGGGGAELGVLDAAFWTDTVPHLVRENLAIRYANMAVHILILAKRPELISPDSAEAGIDHYSLALAHYGLAIKEMRHSGEMRGGVRAAVLCSMLFVVFEALNGDREAAEAHLLCGQRMLDELQQQQRQPPGGIPASSGTGSLRKELRNLLRYILLQVRMGGVEYGKTEFDTLCAEYLEDYVAEESYDASPGYGTPQGPALSMVWPQDNSSLPEIVMDDFIVW